MVSSQSCHTWRRYRLAIVPSAVPPRLVYETQFSGSRAVNQAAKAGFARHATVLQDAVHQPGMGWRIVLPSLNLGEVKGQHLCGHYYYKLSPMPKEGRYSGWAL